MGEYLDKSWKRVDAHKKGYLSGTADITINVANTKYRGLMIELKHPITGGRIKQNQLDYLEKARRNGYKTLLSNDIFEIYDTINEYMRTAEGFTCTCWKKFKNETGLDNHCIMIHKKDTNTGEAATTLPRGVVYTDDKKYFIQDTQLFMIDKNHE